MTNCMPTARPPVLTGHIWRNQHGVAAVEFALVAAVIGLLLPAATDVALAIWANQQVGNAARAGSEYAAAHCWNNGAVDSACANNVSAAATSGTSAAATSQRTAITATPSEFCGNDSASGVTQVCVLPCACTSGPTTGTYVSVTTNTSYTPLFPVLWGTHLTSGSLRLSATSVTRIN